MRFSVRSTLYSSLALFLGNAFAAPTPLVERAGISILSTTQVSAVSISFETKTDKKVYSDRHIHSIHSFCKRILLSSIYHLVLELWW